MARKPQVRYFASRSAYYTQWRGKQHRLADAPADDAPNGPFYLAALKAFGALMSQTAIAADPFPGDHQPVKYLIDQYMCHLDDEGKKQTLNTYKVLVKPFAMACGETLVRDLRPLFVETWFKEQKEKWNPTTRRTAIGKLNRVFNYYFTMGHISKNPIKGKITVPQAVARGKECILPDELQALLLECASPALGKLLLMLQGTGARPGEIGNIEACHYKPELQAIVYRWNAREGYIWKNARKTKKDRVIHLTGELAELVEAQIKEHPSGFLFRARSGTSWNPHAITHRFSALLGHRRVRAWLKMAGMSRKHVVPYSFRHTFITKLLQANLSTKFVADLCGTSVAMIERHYGHLDCDLQRMGDLFRKAWGG
jgi:integrase